MFKNNFKSSFAIILSLLLISNLYSQNRYEVRVTDNFPQKNNTKINQSNSLKESLERGFRELGLNVIFDTSFQDSSIVNQLGNLSVASQIDLLLKQNGLDIAIVENKTIIVFVNTPINRVRVEKVEMKSHKLKYLQAEILQKILSDILPKEQRSFFALDKNTLLVNGSRLYQLQVTALIDALDFAPAIITLDLNFYEISDDKQRDLLAGVNSQGSIPTNPLNLLSFSQLVLNDKNLKYLGEAHLPLLNGRQSSLSIGQKVPIKTASFYNYNPVETSLNPVNMVGKIIQALLPNQSSDNNATYNFESAALELVATPNLIMDSDSEPTLNLTLALKNSYPDAIRINSPIFQEMALSTTQIIDIGKPMLVASWTIDKTFKENRPFIIPFVSLPSKTVKSTRKAIMTLTARVKNIENIAKSLANEKALEERLGSIFSVELLTVVNLQRRTRIVSER